VHPAPRRPRLKIEQPGTGDASRHYDGVVRGLAAHFVWLNHGKQSAALDLTEPSDRNVFTGSWSAPTCWSATWPRRP
jgi:CoA transferase family III